jgi:hypothetical protein
MNERQAQKIKRTICIGLGGTGRDVLMRIRRTIIDRYGSLNELPVVSFLHIDTDKGATQVSGLNTGNTYRGEDILFRDAEKVSTTMTRVEVDNLVQGLQNHPVDREFHPYAHIGAWLSPQILRDLKAIEEGAKGIRPVGRLAFFHNFRKIQNAVDLAEKRTRDREQILVKKGLFIETGLNIFIVGSLCGGTGSGMCLDIAYSLRQFYGDKGGQLFGYLVIAPELYGNTPSMNANTYAALKELNYYATKGTQFTACYDPQQLVYVNEERPPFDYVYLVSNQTASDYKILDKGKLANIIGQKICLDFSGEIAPLIREQRDNFLQHMLQMDEHPRPNVQRYLTFGLAEIYFPRDITNQVALNKVRSRLIQFWLQGEGQSPDARVLLDKFLLKWNANNSQKDVFTSLLEASTQDKNKTFGQTLNSWRSKLESNILEAKTKEERNAIVQLLAREFREQFRKVQSGETESTRGIWLTKLQQEKIHIIEKLQKDIEEFLKELLDPDRPDFSLNNSLAWLEAMTTELNKQQRNLEDKIQSLGSSNSLEEIERKWKDTQQIIEDLERKSSLPFLNKQKSDRIREEAKSGTMKIYEAIKQNFDLALYREGLDIVQNLQKYVQSLNVSGNNFNNLLHSLSGFYDRRESELRQLRTDEMSGEAVIDSKDNDVCYSSLLPDRERRTQLALVTRQINEQIGIDGTLSSFLTRDRFIDEVQLRQEIDVTIDRFFASRSSSQAQSVIKRFLESYSSSEALTRLEQIIREAEPLLPLNLADPYFYNDLGKSLRLIGFKQTEDLEVKQFKNILTRDLGIADSILKATQSEDGVIMIREYAAFPLRLIHGLDRMRQQYLRQQSHDGSFLHNDYQTPFIDIIPPEARKIQELQDIFYPCLAFELLGYNTQSRTYELEYFDSLRDTYYTESLSPNWNEALEQLSQRNEMMEELQNKLNISLEEIEKNLNTWQEYYEPRLQQFVKQVDDLKEDSPNFSYKTTVVGTRGSIDTRAKEGIITRFKRRIQQKIETNHQSSSLLPNAESKRLMGNSVIVEDDRQPNHNIVDRECAGFADRSPDDLIAKLERLKQLLNDGILTQAEFEVAKKRILGT